MQIIIATNNEHKVSEIKSLLLPFGYTAVSLKDAGISVTIEEDGDTFAENAHIKAKTIFELTGKPVIADDSGLEVEFLGNAPGIFSARYGGEQLTDKERYELILSELNGVSMPLRGARFVCAIYCILDSEREFCVNGTVNGYIGTQALGKKGFGYDPIFMINEHESLATISEQQKNEISHRGKALREFVKEMEKFSN